MPSKNLKVFLIGLPGSGKTTLARQVSTDLKIPVFDLDDEIEKLTGKKVQDIFEEAGEQHFRTIETSALKSTIEKNESFIMATGGGAPCFHDNLELMKKSGTVIFLDVPVDEICSRISKQTIDRPLLKGTDLHQKINSLRAQRLPVYSQAHAVVQGTDTKPAQIIDLLG